VATALGRDATVAVIGAGAMGAGIAQVAAQAGHRVLLHDAREGAAARARESVAAQLTALAAKGRLGAAAAGDAAARIAVITDPGQAEAAALVIEAIAEDLAAKRALFATLEAVVDERAILASNTSSLSITALAAGLRRPERVAGMHFFNPAPVMPLVEVVSGLQTADDVAATLYATAQAWGKAPVRARSTPGFIVNRVARPFYAEALRVVSEQGTDCATFDAVMREAGGFRMGPFELMDLIGNDVNFAVTRSVWEAFFHDPRFLPSRLQQERVEAGFLGRKSGRGFYDHAPGAARPAPSSEPAAPPPARVTLHGERGLLGALFERWRAAGVATQAGPAHPAFPDGVLRVADVHVALTDGRTATARSAATGVDALAVLDLALDYGACTRVAFAVADQAPAGAAHAVAGALQAAGIAASRFDDVAGLALMRTVTMLANEAADALMQGVATPADLDLAMRKGVNYPRGPLAWADALGVARVRDVLAHLAAHYGGDRYRISPMLARRAVTGGALCDASPAA
jgi:3-hydroxybutyryl-CoA dehydrogenase